MSLFTRIVRTTVPRVSTQVQRRTIITLKDVKYTAIATASGSGRNGHVTSSPEGTKPLTLDLTTPKALGGTGQGHNPEQLFAAGYSACFLGALQLVAGQSGKKDLVKDAKIHAKVLFGEPNEFPGFGINVEIVVEGVNDQELLKAAHEFCPYSRILTHGAKVTVKSK